MIRRVNKFLADSIETINGLLALIFMAVGALGLVVSLFIPDVPIGYGLLGALVVGLLFPIIVCGPLALLVDMRNALRED